MPSHGIPWPSSAHHMSSSLGSHGRLAWWKLVEGHPNAIGNWGKICGDMSQDSRLSTHHFYFFRYWPFIFQGHEGWQTISRLMVASVSICHHSPVVGKAWEVLLYSSTNMRKKDIHGWCSPQIVSYMPNKWLTPRVNYSESLNCSHCWNSQHISLLVYHCELYYIISTTNWFDQQCPGIIIYPLVVEE
jgi:hypothetical protein